MRRQRALRRLVHRLQRLVDRVARRQRAGDLDRAQPVEVVERLRRDAFAHVDEVGQLHHAAVARAHVGVADVGRRRAVERRDLHDHVVLLAVALEARDLAAAQHRLQRAADGVDGDADVGELVAVDVDAHLGRVEPQVDLQVLHARDTCAPRRGSGRRSAAARHTAPATSRRIRSASSGTTGRATAG